MTHILSPNPPYNFALLLDILARFAHPSTDTTHAGAYWRTLHVADSLALLRVTPQTDGLCVALCAQTGPVSTQEALNRLGHVLPLNTDHTAFYEQARQDNKLWAIVEPLQGLPEWRTASVFEALAQAIIEQQIAWTAAQRAQRWLVEWAGNAMVYEGRSYYAFPTAEQIAAASVDDLKPLKITFKRMGLLIDIAQQSLSGKLDLEALATADPQEAYQYLLQIKGIGHWTAAVTLERALGHRQHITHNDVALQAAVNRYFHGGSGRITQQQLIDTLSPYGAFAGLAAHYTLLRWVLDEYPLRETIT